MIASGLFTSWITRREASRNSSATLASWRRAWPRSSSRFSSALAACAPTPGYAPAGPSAPAVFQPQDFAWSAAGGQGAVNGRVDYREGGQVFGCVGSVGLTPDTPYTRGRFQTLYGSTTAAAIPASVVRARTVADPNADYQQYVREAPCQDGRFSFTGLPDGSWFVIAPVRAEGGEPIALMRRVTTRGGRMTSVEM